MSADVLERFINTRPCVVVAPDYRKAYTEPFPAGFNDCYETLLWATNNAEQLGARCDRVMVAGHSAGGGLTAAVTLKARDSGTADIAFQMPIYPMIDDQQPTDASREMQVPVWSSLTNKVGWGAYLRNCIDAVLTFPLMQHPPEIVIIRISRPPLPLGTLEPFDEAKPCESAG